MPNWNPNYPEVMGLEWWPNIRHTSRVWTGSHGRIQRLSSTVTETIASLKLSATVDPTLKSDTYTIVDVFEAGQEATPIPEFTPQELIPSADSGIDGWVTEAGSTTNLYTSINENVLRWPGPAQSTWLQTTQSTQVYKCAVDSSSFATSLSNSRIGFVEVRAILGANTGFRKTRTGIEIAGTQYAPAGGTLRDVHGFGATYTFWYGELNPATERPWKPSDIVAFGAAGTSRLYVKSEAATATQYPKIYALRLFVHCVPTENRVAVGMYRRPETLTTGQVQAQTDALFSMPAQTTNWNKATAKDYTFYWRQSVCPSLYGPVNADDVRWNGAYQDLGPKGIPDGRAFPLTGDGETIPTTGLGSDLAMYDQFGRPHPNPGPGFAMGSHAAYGIVMTTTGGTVSVDSQPYRTDLDSLVSLVNGGPSAAQRFTMTSTQTFLGVRFPIVPPATADGNLVVALHVVSGGAQIGGSYVITADQARAKTAAPNGWRYLSGFFSAPGTMTSGTQFEVRFSTGTSQPWRLLAPDASLGATASYNGTTNCLALAGVSQTNRDLCVTLVKQPDPPTSPTVAIESVPVTMPNESVRTIQHVRVAWTAPGVSLGSQFRYYELERRLDDETDWVPVAHIRNTAILAYVDHLAPRGVQSFYRVRVLGRSGQFSAWAETAGITPVDVDCRNLVLTSNHDPSLEVVLDQGKEASFDFRNNATNEIVQLQGADYQIVFTEDEDRGVTWTFDGEVNFGDSPPVGHASARTFDALRAITDSKGAIPYVAVLDTNGTKVLAHVTVTNATQAFIGNVYRVTLQIIPTHDEEIPPEVYT